MSAMKLVLVEWLDSFGCSTTWEEIPEDISPHRMVCRSVGWLVYDGDDAKVIVPHLALGSGRPQGCGDMTIPAAAILAIRDLPQFGLERSEDGETPRTDT